MKKAALIALSALMTVGISAAAFAGSWQVDNRGWWYLNDNGTWPVNTWQTINGKNYYFDTDGYMAESQYIGGTLVNITGEALPTAYGSIIREYIDCIHSQDPDTFRENHVLNYELSRPAAYQNCGYWLIDLDGDGVEELLLGEDAYYDADSGWNAIYAGYTLADGQAVQFLDGWARNRYSLCEGNYLMNEASSGASNTVVNIYRFDGKGLQLVEGFHYDNWENPDQPWHYGTAADMVDGGICYPWAVTEAQWEGAIAKYKVIPIHYNRFSSIMGVQ